jgi:hypothetical protein
VNSRLHVKTLPLLLIGDHNLNFALENDIEFRPVLPESKHIFAFVIEVVLEFLAQKIYVLITHISLLEESNFFE